MKITFLSDWRLNNCTANDTQKYRKFMSHHFSFENQRTRVMEPNILRIFWRVVFQLSRVRKSINLSIFNKVKKINKWHSHKEKGWSKIRNAFYFSIYLFACFFVSGDIIGERIYWKVSMQLSMKSMLFGEHRIAVTINTEEVLTAFEKVNESTPNTD